MTIFKSALIAIGMILTPVVVLAQTPATAPAPVAAPTISAVDAKADAAAPAVAASVAATPATPVTSIGTSAPTNGVGQPISGAYGLQAQVTDIGQRAANMHNYILMPVMTVISLFVLGLLMWIIVRYRRAANPVASKTSHNTFIEVVWTLIPVLILVGISIPSISLLAAQYKPAPANAVTLKAIGNQWYWTYEYPDYGLEITSNMLSESDAKAKGEPVQLAVDNRVVLPVGTPIKLLTTGADVIHSWAMPAFWIKMDAVPGRINETSFTIAKTGVYYGQCSELCGDRHGFMPIGVEVVSKEDFEKWVRAKGGKMPGDAPAAAAPAAVAPTTAAALTPAAPVAAPVTETAAAPAAAAKN
jgi:cytochrome c oxidase subunit II